MTTIAICLILAVLATLCHEVGHLGGAYLVGAEIRGVGLSWAGPYVHARVDPPCRWKAVICLLSGCGVNLALALGCWWFEMDTAALVNALMAGFNLVLPKSDGWQAWKAASGWL
jgi:hypothetical protein